MAKPRRSTRDEFLDQFADFDVQAQEALIDVMELIHRQAKRRRDVRKTSPESKAGTDADGKSKKPVDDSSVPVQGKLGAPE